MNKAEYKYDVFISYANEDKQTAYSLKHMLSSHGIKVWIDDEHIQLGDSIVRKIEEGIKSSKFLLLCISENFFKSSWCKGEYEPLLAREISTQETSILPVIINHYDEKNFPYFLFAKKTLDIREQNGFESIAKSILSHKDIQTRKEAEVVLEKIKKVQDEIVALQQLKSFDDQALIKTDKVCNEILGILFSVPACDSHIHTITLAYQNIIDKILLRLEDLNIKRALHHKMSQINAALENLSVGQYQDYGILSVGEEILDNPYAFLTQQRTSIENCIDKLLGNDEIEKCDGIDWILKDGSEQMYSRLIMIKEMGKLKDVSSVFWDKSLRIYIYYPKMFWPVMKFFLIDDHVLWHRKLLLLKLTLNRTATIEKIRDEFNNLSALVSNCVYSRSPG